ncbi:transposase [Nocardia wallacei]|uniref:transposase n=1 Tax=Nocardia wallacei TaxID=480035 RepID=UPI002456FEA5|nr:transposase [Nocardia wallacei]
MLERVPSQGDLLRSTVAFCAGRVAENSIYAVLHRECGRLFPDEMFADLFTDVGRRSVPPLIVAVVIALQRIEGLSDREAVERFAFDARWKCAAGGFDFDYPVFVHTVVVDIRARLARSDRPDRIFDAVLEMAREAGLVGRKRVLDSTPLYDAVATMDTITLLRSAIRGLLAVARRGAGCRAASMLPVLAPTARRWRIMSPADHNLGRLRGGLSAKAHVPMDGVLARRLTALIGAGRAAALTLTRSDQLIAPATGQKKFQRQQPTRDFPPNSP